jgi:hypothetical protein
MANTLTLEEAAQQLGLTVEQFKVNLKTHKGFKAVRPLMGGTTMHFREQDVQELARKLGLGSDPGLQLGDASSDAIIPLGVKEDDDQVEIGREQPHSSGSSSARLKSPSSQRLKPDQPMTVESGTFVPVVSEEGGKRSDSDVKLAKGSDSNVRLERKGAAPAGTPTEEIDLDAEQRKKGKEDSSSKVFELADEGSKSGKKSDKHKATAKKPINNSDFELQLGSDSDSEFELTLADDSDEVDLGALPRDVSGKKGKSGVKLNKPADSGISLEKSDSDSEFELNLDSSKSSKITGPKSDKNKQKPDSDSEFELTLDDSSGEVSSLDVDKVTGEEQKDIFATDFDIPALDEESGSEAVQLEDGDTDLESSDFDLALDDSGGDESASEVVQLDEDLDEAGEDRPKRKGRKSGAMDEDDVSAEEALADVDEEEEEEVAPAAVGAPAARPWGPLPALVLFPCLFLMLIVTFMSFELLHGMWSYRQGASKPTYTITRGIAGLFVGDSELPKE